MPGNGADTHRIEDEKTTPAQRTHLYKVVDQAIIEVHLSEMCVPAVTFTSKHSILDRQQRHIKGAATTEVKNQHVPLPRLPLGLFVQIASDGCSRRLVDYSQHFELRDGGGILCRLPL